MRIAEPLVVDDATELVALHRALFEAQFAKDPEDRDVPGSPLIAALANRVVGLLARQDARWEDWRRAELHPDRVSIVGRRLRSRPGWPQLSRVDRTKMVLDSLAPLIAGDELIQRLVEEG